MTSAINSKQPFESKAKIFISYSRSDAAFAGCLEVALKAHGLTPPIDPGVPECGYWNKLQVGKPVTKKRTRLKFFVGLHQSVRYEKRSLSKPSKQQAFGKRHMQEVNKQAVKRNPGEKRENKRN